MAREKSERPPRGQCVCKRQLTLHEQCKNSSFVVTTDKFIDGLRISFQQYDRDNKPTPRTTPKPNGERRTNVADTRYGNILALEGIGAKPGSSIEVKVNGKTIKLTADKTGKFVHQDTPC